MIARCLHTNKHTQHTHILMKLTSLAIFSRRSLNFFANLNSKISTDHCLGDTSFSCPFIHEHRALFLQTLVASNWRQALGFGAKTPSHCRIVSRCRESGSKCIDRVHRVYLFVCFVRLVACSCWRRVIEPASLAASLARSCRKLVAISANNGLACGRPSSPRR